MNDKSANKDNFDNFSQALSMSLNFAVLMRGSYEELKKITDFLEQQKYVQIVFSQISADEIIIKRKNKDSDHNDK